MQLTFKDTPLWGEPDWQNCTAFALHIGQQRIQTLLLHFFTLYILLHQRLQPWLEGEKLYILEGEGGIDAEGVAREADEVVHELGQDQVCLRRKHSHVAMEALSGLLQVCLSHGKSPS